MRTWTDKYACTLYKLLQHALIRNLKLAWAIDGMQDHTLNAPASYVMKEAVQCLCEGGRGCTREDPARQEDPNAVPGLHSNWVGQHVLAMARPWQDNVVKFDLVNRFKELNIGMIINLQEVRSNSSCKAAACHRASAQLNGSCSVQMHCSSLAGSTAGACKCTSHMYMLQQQYPCTQVKAKQHANALYTATRYICEWQTYVKNCTSAV
jgi:hypothetical protein